jgi:hypothetical protein
LLRQPPSIALIDGGLSSALSLRQAAAGHAPPRTEVRASSRTHPIEFQMRALSRRTFSASCHRSGIECLLKKP